MGRDKIGIVSMGIALPERVFENDDWSQYVETSDDWIRSRTGIERRRVAADDETTATLATEAARQALVDGHLSASDIDEIIVATDTPEVPFPDTACFVQHQLGAREVPAFTLGGSGCAGFIQALEIARSRVAFHNGRVLVIGVELLTRIMDWRNRDTCVLFGDAAGAVVVTAGTPRAEILTTSCGTDGSKIDILKLEVGGTRSPLTAERVQAREHLHIEMKGREVFRHAVTRMTQACNDVLDRQGLSLSDVDLVIPHQANLRIIHAVAKKLGVSMDKVFTNVQNYGNTGSASVPLALFEAERCGALAPGATLLLTAFGAGFHWAAAALRYNGRQNTSTQGDPPC